MMVILSTGLVFAVVFLTDITTRLQLLSGGRDKSNREPGGAESLLGFSALAPALGNLDSRVKIIGFFDFQCPFSAEEAAILEQVKAKYGTRIYLQFRHFPIKNGSREISEASMCANEQGKFWAYHDLLFANQINQSEMIKPLAKEAGLDEAVFADCVKSRRFRDQVQEDFDSAIKLQVLATPTFFINGHKVQGVIPLEAWEKIIKEYE
ncbi:MAG: hypothetical protein UW45_C0013G0010 [Parcubacteria group bacterium GW2011_GWC2_44_22]|nr:MAG: hypothetical protein UW45_C0013G0010 [Parcubacteria group bacterium GW2011_GWC2_44_22]